MRRNEEEKRKNANSGLAGLVGGDPRSNDEREIFNRSINYNKCKSSRSDWKNANSH